MAKLTTIYDFVDGSGTNTITQWRTGLASAQQGKIDLRIKVLIGQDSMSLPNFVTPTSEGKIFEIVIKGQVALRPMLCRGPLVPEKELTLLLGAKERDKKYDPKNAPKIALGNRELVVTDPDKHRVENEFSKEAR